MHFTITGMTANGIKVATREKAASAIVIAMKWTEQGVRNVRIAPPGEEAQPFGIIQAKHYPASRRV